MSSALRIAFTYGVAGMIIWDAVRCILYPALVEGGDYVRLSIYFVCMVATLAMIPYSRKLDDRLEMLKGAGESYELSQLYHSYGDHIQGHLYFLIGNAHMKAYEAHRQGEPLDRGTRWLLTTYEFMKSESEETHS